MSDGEPRVIKLTEDEEHFIDTALEAYRAEKQKPRPGPARQLVYSTCAKCSYPFTEQEHKTLNECPECGNTTVTLVKQRKWEE